MFSSALLLSALVPLVAAGANCPFHRATHQDAISILDNTVHNLPCELSSMGSGGEQEQCCLDAKQRLVEWHALREAADAQHQAQFTKEAKDACHCLAHNHDDGAHPEDVCEQSLCVIKALTGASQRKRQRRMRDGNNDGDNNNGGNNNNDGGNNNNNNDGGRNNGDNDNDGRDGNNGGDNNNGGNNNNNDGRNNNPTIFERVAGVDVTSRSGDWTAAETVTRLGDANYGDANAVGGADLPSARAISNAVFAAENDFNSPEQEASDFFWVWGQFVDHDVVLSPHKTPVEAISISVPDDDTVFTPGSSIGMSRSDYVDDTSGVRQQLNHITPLIDASNVYGSEASRVAYLREGAGGRLRFSGSAFNAWPPLYDESHHEENEAGNGEATYIVGDVRGNEQPLLLGMHTLFLREHNRWAEELASADPSLTDDQLFEQARAMVEALIQWITVNEFLPMLLGERLPAYRGFRDNVDAQVSNEFATAAFRFGHSLVSDELWSVNAQGVEVTASRLSLRDAFFDPASIAEGDSFEQLFRGAARHHCQPLDALVVDALRNFLFGSPMGGGLDLVAFNIQRGRDHGLPSYNDVRAALGMRRQASFTRLTGRNAPLADALASVYDSVDDVDLFVGGLAERATNNGDSQLGPLFHRIVRDQFELLRDSDPHWFERRLPEPVAEHVRQTTLADVIARNTGIARDQLQDDVMRAQQ